MPTTYALFALTILLNCAASILGGFYNRRVADLKNTSMLYSFLKLAAIFAFWVFRFALDGFSCAAGVIPYALGLALCFFCGVYGFIGALRTGSNVISSLLLSASSILVSVWGILFWGEALTAPVAVGLVLVLLSLFLCLFSGRRVGKCTRPVWFFYVAITFFGNAGCSIIMNEQRIAFQDRYAPFLMMSAIGLCTVATGLLFFLGDRSDAGKLLKRAWHFPVIEGVCNGMMNMIGFILLASPLSINLLYPARSVIGLILITLFSALIFKERMRWWQWIGVAVGTAAVGILAV